MSEWTKGEWSVKKCRHGWLDVWAGEENKVCELRGIAEEEANAHLIAAAPELYDALKNLLAVHNCDGGTKYHCGEIAEAALAKARGE